MGQAGAGIRPSHPFLQRPAQQHRDPARHACAPYRNHTARHHLVQIRLYAETTVREAGLSGAAGTHAPDLPLQQPDVRGDGVPD